MVENLASGWASGLRARLDIILGVAQTRLELLTVELQEEKLRVARLLFMTILTALFLGFAAVFAAVWLTVGLWDTHRLLALGICTLLFFGLGIVCATVAARTLAAGSGLFAASLAELRQDRQALQEHREP